MSENATRLKAVLLALGILIVGVILGATAHRWLPAAGDKQAQKPPARPRIPQLGATSERLLKRIFPASRPDRSAEGGNRSDPGSEP